MSSSEKHVVLDVFSALDDRIELIPFALSQAPWDTSLEYPQHDFLGNSKNKFFNGLPFKKCHFYPLRGNQIGFWTTLLEQPYEKATLPTSCEKKIEFHHLMTRSNDQATPATYSGSDQTWIRNNYFMYKMTKQDFCYCSLVIFNKFRHILLRSMQTWMYL